MVVMSDTRKTVGVSKAEARLVATLRRALVNEAARSRRRRVTAVELESFQGIADLVVGELNGRHMLPRKVPLKRLEFFSFSTAKILAALHGRKNIRISEIAEDSGLSETTVRRELRKLRDTRIVDIVGRDRVRILHAVSTPFSEMVAFEVKVKDWKSGLRQARSYKSFANRTYLALPIDRADSIKQHVDVFRRFNVGLLGIEKGGGLRWFAKTRRSSPISPARNFYASVQLLKNTPLLMFKSARKP